MTAKASLGAGNVEIELDGETCILRPSLKAAQGVSRMSGGIMGAFEAVSKFDLDTMTAVIAFGLNKSPKDVAESVYTTGQTELVEPVSKFLQVLANGGRPIDEDGGEGEKDPQ